MLWQAGWVGSGWAGFRYGMIWQARYVRFRFALVSYVVLRPVLAGELRSVGFG